MEGLHRNSPLQTLNARVKLILSLAFILSVSLTPTGAWALYIIFLTVTLSVSLLSRVGMGWMLKRSLLALPFLLAAAPLVFWGPGPLHPYPLFNSFSISISPAGVERFGSIALKSWISVQAAVLFTAVTPVSQMLIAMRSLGIPAVFVSIFSLMWRYLDVLREEALRLLRARSSRSARPADMPNRRVGGTVLWRGRVAGGMAGNLLLRALERSDRLYQAMLARGYNGSPPFYQVQAFNPVDRQILWGGITLLILLLLFGVLMGGG